MAIELSTGWIVGIVCGVFVVFAVAIVFFMFFRRRVIDMETPEKRGRVKFVDADDPDEIVSVHEVLVSEDDMYDDD